VIYRMVTFPMTLMDQ